MNESLEALRGEVLDRIQQSNSEMEIEQLRVEVLGRKGKLTLLLRGLADLPAEERPQAGQELNQLRRVVKEHLDERLKVIKEQSKERALEEEKIDITLPGTRCERGRAHPLTLVLDEIIDVFWGMGFEIARGPDIEDDYHNFEALNIPRDHPARDMQDTFYLSESTLLRTHTSPVQIRAMLAQKPPVRIIVPGKVYRRDVVDMTHSPMFHQVEGLAVDRAITMADLKGTLELFAREMFGPRSRIRFRPSFFPFTEPSAEVDVLCFVCHGDGCRLCKQGGWLEILGSGMVHPQVLRNVGYDPEEVTGWAFGMGIERIAMLKYGIDDLRLFFENDLRFLKQFA